MGDNKMLQPRDPAHVEWLMKLSNQAAETYAAYFALANATHGTPFRRPHDVTAEDLELFSQDERMAWVLLLIGHEWFAQRQHHPDAPGKCGWCIYAAGNTQAAADAAPLYEDSEKLRAHVAECEHMPTVAKLNTLRAKMRELAHALDGNAGAMIEAVLDG